MESTLREYNSPRTFVVNTWQHLPHLLSSCNTSSSSVSVKVWFNVSGMIVRRSIKCKQSPVCGVFWPLLPLSSTDRNETRTWSSLSPRNLPIKFGTNPSTIVLVIVVTDIHIDKQTHKPTPVKHTPTLSRGEISVQTDRLVVWQPWRRSALAERFVVYANTDVARYGFAAETHTHDTPRKHSSPKRSYIRFWDDSPKQRSGAAAIKVHTMR